MRVWVVDDVAADKPGSLGGLLRQLQDRAGTGLQVLGVAAHQPDFTEAMSKLLPDLLDLIIVRESAWPAGADLQPLLSLGAGLLIVGDPDEVERFRPLAEQFPVWFLHAAPTAEALWLALLGTSAGRRRHAAGKAELARLQQRLDDRIIIERAKGIMVHDWKMTEEVAYQKLRVWSRQQRRQIRDIAQSVLDTKSLLGTLPSDNGAPPFNANDEAHPRDQAASSS